MIIRCPGCNKKIDIVEAGKHVCLKCKARFFVNSAGKIKVIQLVKNNYLAIIGILIYPGSVIFFYLAGYFDEVTIFVPVILLLFGPLLGSIRTVILSDTFTVLLYYDLFFNKKMHLMDKATQIAIILLITSNAFGLLLLLLKVVSIISSY
ncbi:MAG: zinc-ribbon domain-containing protein [Spirochaetaceae bacterium]